LELLRFKLLRIMVGSGIKAKVLGEFISSKGLLTGNVVELVPMKIQKNVKTIACLLRVGYTECNRVARCSFDIGDQAESCAQLFYVKERIYRFEQTLTFKG